MSILYLNALLLFGLWNFSLPPPFPPPPLFFPEKLNYTAPLAAINVQRIDAVRRTLLNAFVRVKMRNPYSKRLRSSGEFIYQSRHLPPTRTTMGPENLQARVGYGGKKKTIRQTKKQTFETKLDKNGLKNNNGVSRLLWKKEPGTVTGRRRCISPSIPYGITYVVRYFRLEKKLSFCRAMFSARNYTCHAMPFFGLCTYS